MTRRPFQPTPLAAAIQVASLSAVAIGVFCILVTDISGRKTEVAKVEAPSTVQTSAMPHKSDATAR